MSAYTQQQLHQQQQQQYQQQYTHQQYYQQQPQQPQPQTHYAAQQYQQHQQPHYPPPPQPPPPPPPPNQLQPAYDASTYYYQQQHQHPQQPTQLPPQPHPTTTANASLPVRHLPPVAPATHLPAYSLPVTPIQSNTGRYQPPSPTRHSRSSIPPRHPPAHFHPYKGTPRPPHPQPHPPPTPSHPPPFPPPRSGNVRNQSPRNHPPPRPRNLPSTTPANHPSPSVQKPLKPAKNPVHEVVREILSMFIHGVLIMKTTEDQKAILESPESLTREFKKFITPATFEEAKRKLSMKSDVSAATQTAPEYIALLGNALATHHIFHSVLATARHAVLGTDEATTPNKRAVEVLGENWERVKLAKAEAKEAKRLAAFEANGLKKREHARNGGTEGTAGNEIGSEVENVSRRARSPRKSVLGECVAVLRKQIEKLERKVDTEGRKEDAGSASENLAAAHDAVLRAELAAEAAREQGRVRVEKLCMALENRDAARAERDDTRARFEAYRKAVEEYLPMEVKSKHAQEERQKEEVIASSTAESEELKIEIRQVREILDELKLEAANYAKQRDSMSRMAEVQAEEFRRLREQTQKVPSENPLPSTSSSSHEIPSNTTATNESVDSSTEPQVEGTKCLTNDRILDDLSMDIFESDVKSETDEGNDKNIDEKHAKDNSMDIVERNVKGAIDEENFVSNEECNPGAEELVKSEHESELYFLDYGLFGGKEK